VSFIAISSAFNLYLGRYGEEPRQAGPSGRRDALFLAGFLVCWHYEAEGNPILTQLASTRPDGNMEGQGSTVRIFNSPSSPRSTPTLSCALSMRCTMRHAARRLVPSSNIELGEVVYGGVAAGLYGMRFCHVAVLSPIDGGRSPSISAKKIQVLRSQKCRCCLLVSPWTSSLHAWACVSDWARRVSTTRVRMLWRNALRLQLATGNNGSAFAA